MEINITDITPDGWSRLLNMASAEGKKIVENKGKIKVIDSHSKEGTIVSIDQIFSITNRVWGQAGRNLTAKKELFRSLRRISEQEEVNFQKLGFLRKLIHSGTARYEERMLTLNGFAKEITELETLPPIPPPDIRRDKRKINLHDRAHVTITPIPPSSGAATGKVAFVDVDGVRYILKCANPDSRETIALGQIGLKKEFNLLRDLNHKNVIRLIDDKSSFANDSTRAGVREQLAMGGITDVVFEEDPITLPGVGTQPLAPRTDETDRAYEARVKRSEIPVGLYGIYELAGEGRLDKMLEDGVLTTYDKINYLAQVACGLDYLHSQGIVHQDIKDNNIMLAAGSLPGERVVKIIDMDCAYKIIPHPRSGDQVYSREFGGLEGAQTNKAPEVLYSSPEDLAQLGRTPLLGRVDSWALGLLIARSFDAAAYEDYALFTQFKGFFGTPEEKRANMEARAIALVKNISDNPAIPAEVKIAVAGLLAINPRERMDEARAQELLVIAQVKEIQANTEISPEEKKTRINQAIASASNSMSIARAAAFRETIMRAVSPPSGHGGADERKTA